MKRIMTAALALSLMAGTSAFAQDRGERRGEREERRSERSENREERREEKAEAKQERRERRAEHLASPTPRRSERAEEVLAQVRARNAARAEVRQDRREDRREDRQERRADRRVDRQEQRVVIVPRVGDSDRDRRERIEEAQRRGSRVIIRRPGEGHALRHRDQGRSWYDSARYRHSYRATHRYRVPRYAYPSGWYVRSWSFGDYLPHRSWYSQPYYLDWWRYGLPRPPIGTEWIRMRDNAVLVDIWSGRVLAVYYDLFW